MGVNEDKLDMFKGIFEEQRELTDDEMKVYKDMLRRKEIKATESGFNQTVQKDQATLIAELISRVTSLEDTVEFILEQLEIDDETDEEWYDWREEQEYEDRWGGITDDNME